MPKKVLNPTAKIAKNSVVQLLAGVLNKILGVTLVIYAARQLGTDGFGQYSYILSLQSIFYIVTDFGLGTLTTRDLAKNPAQEARYFINVLVLRAGLSLLAGAGMVAAILFLNPTALMVKLACVCAATLFLLSNIDTATAIFNAHQRMEVTSTIAVAANVFRVSVSLLVLLAGGGVLALIWVHAAYALLQLGILLGILFYFIRPVWHVDFGFWKKMLREAYPLALANLFSVVYFKVDSVMLGSLSGEKAVGLYNAAYRLLELTIILPAYYCGAIFPVIASSFGTHPQRFLLIYRRSLKYMWLCSLPIAAGAAMLAPEFIDILYGPQYAPSIPVLSVLMWSLVLIAINSINAPYLIVMGKQQWITWLVLASMIFNIALNFVFIPGYGILGAAWVTLASEIFNIVLFLWALHKPLELNLRMLRHLFKPALAAAGMAYLLTWITGWDVGYQVLAGGGCYLLLLFIFRVFDEVDWELFGRIFRRNQA